MSVIETVKKKVLGEQSPLYECENCGTEFRSSLDPDDYWFECPECDSGDAQFVGERDAA